MTLKYLSVIDLLNYFLFFTCALLSRSWISACVPRQPLPVASACSCRFLIQVLVIPAWTPSTSVSLDRQYWTSALFRLPSAVCRTIVHCSSDCLLVCSASSLVSSSRSSWSDKLRLRFFSSSTLESPSGLELRMV